MRYLGLFIWEIMVDFNLDIDADLKNLDKFLRDLEGDIWAVTMVAAHNIEGRAKTLVRVDTGNLKNSINVFEQNKSDLTARIGTNVAYGPANEFGTAAMAAQPYMVPALESERRPYTQALTQVLKRGES